MSQIDESSSEYQQLIETKRLSVCAFRFDRLLSRFSKEEGAFFGEPEPPLLPIAKVTAPHANNSNLHAQDGLFTLELQDLKNKLNIPVDRRPLPELVDQYLDLQVNPQPRKTGATRAPAPPTTGTPEEGDG